MFLLTAGYIRHEINASNKIKPKSNKILVKNEKDNATFLSQGRVKLRSMIQESIKEETWGGERGNKKPARRRAIILLAIINYFLLSEIIFA